MPKGKVTCQTVVVTVKLNDEVIAYFDDIPAFTRDSEDLVELITEYLDEYINEEPVSVADFALYLLPKADAEPRYQ